ncbi:CD109 antigen-like isoform X1 [Rhagoletis pomonella]|uniref:CD109 antigen-like isoform X1 n=1 Tax=Rhagoletis pomonella TaxID=28610 RepID=UPI001780DBCE|nr:CD109 antigen-like isoform X1 [Rhagoletis pomonella]XP_036328136.1 CD109 antigen-like isoform X1 [Rhagoletis pomonella]XP_036328137.1 CD109 antigen-like isoform X1 [Rhagoletis pomonella]XP_036328138.1 CD109 antigen-like isoform X1 [Rhagoletis pomonella]
MTRRLCVAALGLLQIVAMVYAAGHYSVIGPGTIRSNFKYNVAVSVHKAEGPCKIDVAITGPSYNETKTVEVQPMSTENVEFDVPTLKEGDYNLTAKGVSGITFENSTKLNYADYKPAIFIQTDKATYKPGDLVQFRVLFLDANTRPAKIDKPITILINDGAQNRIKQLKDVKPTKGVYTDEFQLSEQPVLGNWNIDVLIDGQNPETKSFEVAKYVLPKFEVSIETAKDVAIPDGVIKVTVRSKYTYGKAVKGKASVSIKPIYHYYGNNDHMEANKTIDVDGKGHVEFDLTKELGISKEHSYVPPLKLLAIMEEELTGNKQNATATVNLHAERYRIEGVDVPYTYHPGKPIKITVVVKNVDGSPVRDTKNKAKLIVDPPRNYILRGFRGEPNAEATTEKPEDMTLEFESNLDEHGMASFEFTLPETDRYFSIKCQFLDTSTYLNSISKFTQTIDAPELLKLTVNTEKPRLGKPVTVEVKSSESIPYFVYTIVARGNIVKSEHVDVPEGRKSQLIKFLPTFEMVPKANFYVHFVFNNNLVFEEKSIAFEKEFENSIDISAQPQAKPGEDVQLQIKTDPESFVGLLGVDQSVLLLKSGNDINKDQIFNSLSNFEASTPWMRGYGRYPGQESGVVTMTNANYPYNDEAQLTYWTISPIAEEELIFHDIDIIAAEAAEAAFRENAIDDIAYFAAHLHERRVHPPIQLFYHIRPLALGRPIPAMAAFNGFITTTSPPMFYATTSASPIDANISPKIRQEFAESWIFDNNDM